MRHLTKIGVEQLLDRIEKHIISLPEDESMTTKDLEFWLKGYSKAQFTIMQLINDFTEEQHD